MSSPKINYFNPKNPAATHQFYILCKGLNSGKPSDIPSTNSFVCQCNTQQQKDFYFWLCFGLWKAKHFHQFLSGSVIPFITIREFKNVIKDQAQNIEPKKGQFKTSIEKVKLLEEKEKNIRMYLQQIQDLKRAMIRQHLR